MSKVDIYACDNCGYKLEGASYSSPAGWVTAYGGKPNMHLHFCGWNCLRAHLNKILDVAQSIDIVGVAEAAVLQR